MELTQKEIDLVLEYRKNTKSDKAVRDRVLEMLKMVVEYELWLNEDAGRAEDDSCHLFLHFLEMFPQHCKTLYSKSEIYEIYENVIEVARSAAYDISMVYCEEIA